MLEIPKEKRCIFCKGTGNYCNSCIGKNHNGNCNIRNNLCELPIMHNNDELGQFKNGDYFCYICHGKGVVNA